MLNQYNLRNILTV